MKTMRYSIDSIDENFVYRRDISNIICTHNLEIPLASLSFHFVYRRDNVYYNTLTENPQFQILLLSSRTTDSLSSYRRDNSIFILIINNKL